jgi:hypothetical protein
MGFPFTAQQFFAVFEAYNLAVWPAQIVFYFLAALVFLFVLHPTKESGRFISAVLAFFWLWMGLIYHWSFFSPINPAARLFAFFFVVQGLLFFYAGAVRGKLTVVFDSRAWRSRLGLLLLLFGPLFYPLLGYSFGHTFPHSPTFGLPCPTTIFTLGVLLLSTAPASLFLIPLLWSGLGFMAALSLGVKEDASLLGAGLLTLIFLLAARKKGPHPTDVSA